MMKQNVIKINKEIEKVKEVDTHDIKSTVWPFKIDTLETWAYCNNAFSKEECEQIIKWGKKNKIEKARLSFNSKLDKKMRDSYVSWIYPNLENNNIFKRLTDIVTDLNNKYFKFNLYGLAEGLQFTNYKAPSGKYGKHVDRGLNMQIRKLSFSLQLSDPKNYEGGDLCLYEGDKPLSGVPKEQGTIILFPSYVLHEVTPVTKGERNSLVGWITGEAFK